MVASGLVLPITAFGMVDAPGAEKNPPKQGERTATHHALLNRRVIRPPRGYRTHGLSATGCMAVMTNLRESTSAMIYIL